MFFLAQFVHRDLTAWRKHLRAHMDWLAEQERAGTVAASGPLTDADESELRAATIVLRARDRDAARAVLEGDPFMVHGVTEDLVLRGWNPFIGTFAGETTPPAQLAMLLAD